MAKILMKGNVAIAEAAIRAGCNFFAGYPITPQNEIPEYMSWRLSQVDGVFVQAESELASINMVLGAAIAGARAMTSSSSPGISLMQEGISYMAGCEIPALIINMVRGGPGLGGIGGSQGDYFQTTRGGGHGDYRVIALAPSTVQESVDLIKLSFDLADKYRNPVIFLGDGTTGQMMEPVEFKDYDKDPMGPVKVERKGIENWILNGAKGREPRLIKSLYLAPGKLEEHNWHLDEKYKKIEQAEVRYEELNTNDAEIIIVAYGISGRISKGAVKEARKAGIKAGLIRPITVWPFPYKVIRDAAKKAKKFLVVEMSAGQLIDDVLIGVNGQAEVSTVLHPAGMPMPEEVLEKIKSLK